MGKKKCKDKIDIINTKVTPSTARKAKKP